MPTYEELMRRAKQMDQKRQRERAEAREAAGRLQGAPAAPEALPLPGAARENLRTGALPGAFPMGLPGGMGADSIRPYGGGIPLPGGGNERESTRRESLQARQLSQMGVERYLQQEAVRDNRQALHDILAGEQAALEDKREAEAAYSRLRQQETRRWRSREQADPALTGQLRTAAQAAEERRRAVQSVDYVKRHLGKTYEDNFAGQFGASVEMGRLNQDAALAWSRYLAQPTEENRAYAEAVGALMSSTALRNRDALSEDATLPWVSQSLAGYLPQFLDQTAAGVKGALPGAALGAMAGPGGAITGAKAGYMAGRANHGFEIMQGAAFKSLLDAGVPEDTARRAARDEGFVSSLIEAADAGVDLLTLGGGKLLSLLGKGGAKAAATAAGESALKRAGRILAGYGLNILGEGAQEYVQEGVSIANQRRALEGHTGQFDLAGRALGVVGDAVTGRDSESAAQMNRAGAEGMKIAAMAGGASLAGNTVMGHALTTGREASANRAIDRAYGAMLDSGMFSPEARDAAARADARLGIKAGARPLLTYQQAEEESKQKAPELAEGQKNTASIEEAGYSLAEAEVIRHEGKTFRNLVAGFDSSVAGFFGKWKNGRKNQQGEKLEKLYLGKMTDSVKSQVSNVLRYEVTERNFILTNDDVKHIMDEHGDAETELRQGNIPLDTWVFDALPEVVMDPDSVTPGHRGSGKKNAGKIGVRFIKTFPGGKVVCVQFDNKGRGTMEITTLYAKEGTTTSEMDTGKPAPIRTSETPEPVLPSTPSIAHGATGGNSQFAPKEGARFPAGGETVDTSRPGPYDRAKGGLYHGGEEIADPGGVYGDHVRGEAAGGEGQRAVDAGGTAENQGESVQGGTGGETSRGLSEYAVLNPGPGARRAADILRRYGITSVAVEGGAMRRAAGSAPARTQGGTVFVANDIPEHMADLVGYHEAVHGVRQGGSRAYQALLEKSGDALLFGNRETRGILKALTEARYPRKDFLGLSDAQKLRVIDELNAVVWGYYKTAPDTARAQFSGVFRDYGAFIAELDGIMEGARGDLESLYRSAPPETLRDDGDYYEGLFREQPPAREGDTPEYLDALSDWISGATDGFLGDAAMEGALGSVAAVRTDRSLPGKTAREKAEEAWSFFQRKMVDAGDSVARVGKAAGDKYLYPSYHFVRASANAAESMIRPKGAQTNVCGIPLGPSVADLWEPVRAKGKEYYHAFEHYLYSRHNVDRMSRANRGAVVQAEAALLRFDEQFPEIARLTEQKLKAEAANGRNDLEARERFKLLEAVAKAEAMRNKPVFGWEIDADTSRADAARYEREHPEFAALAEKVYQFNRNLMQYRVNSGLLTREQADHIEAVYPHYVPTFREGYRPNQARGGKGLQVGKTVGRAQGGTSDLMPLHVAMARQTMRVVREGTKNIFGARLLDGALTHKGRLEPYIKGVEEYAHTVNQDTFDALEDNTPRQENTFTVYRDGKAWVMTLDPGLYEGVQALSPPGGESNVLMETSREANELFKALVTGYNPMFMARNFARDLQDAGLYSRNFGAWAENYPKALREIATDGAVWRQYKALGGVYSSVFDYDHGYSIEKERSALRRQTVDRVEAVNIAIEQAPRLAEFMAITQKGDGSIESLMDAMLGAADVTVNFGRSGTWGRWLNQNFVPFLNPGIQGFDRMARRFFGKKSAGEWVKLLVRASALAIVPAIINGLIYRDDPEWEDLRESDKDTNYLVKLGDGQWLKIPKGRDASVLGIISTRGGRLMRGDEVDWGAALKTAANQIAPANPLENNIMAAWVDADLLNRESPGRTWYGADIESQRLQSYLPGKRYDEGTDVFSKWLGGALNLSPKKINYLLDQYSGVVGDFVLPLLSPKGNKNPLAPLKNAFVLDSVSSNKLNGEFYGAADRITYAKNGGDPAMGVVGRFWNKQAGAVGDIYAQIRELENDGTLPNAEKQEQIRAAKAIINGIEKNALGVLDDYEAAVRRHYTDDSDAAMDRTYREANREVFGAEYALEVYDKDVHTRAVKRYAVGVGYDDFYDAYFTVQEAGGEGKGKTDRQRTALLEMDGLTPEEKARLGSAILGDKRGLDYSGPDALAVSLLRESARGKAEEAREAGISYGIFLEAYRAQLGVESDKDREGKTIPLSEARKKKAAVDAATYGLTKRERRVLYELLGISEKVWEELPRG